MKKLLKNLLSSVTCLMFCWTALYAADKENFSVAPKNNNGQKWRIAYYEGGEFIDYQQILTETVRALMRLGWIEVADVPRQKGEQTQGLWDWMATQTKSEYIEFVKDAYYSANWDEGLRKQTVETLIKRLSQKKDLDLIIAMGTWAGKDLANNKHSISTLVMSSSDPVAAGIIKSVEDSGYEHVHANVDPYLFERQVKIFHEIIGFKKLGLAYENSVDGRSYAAVDIVQKVAAERGFKVIPCHTQSDISDSNQAALSVKRCFEDLVKNADAIYVTQQGGVNKKSIPDLVQIANQHHIPTFSQAGSEEVKYGLLVSISQAGFKYESEFHAETIAKVLNGAKPNQLSQLFEQPPKIAINLKTAEIIGFDPPVIILGAADEIFKETIQPKAD